MVSHRSPHRRLHPPTRCLFQGRRLPARLKRASLSLSPPRVSTHTPPSAPLRASRLRRLPRLPPVILPRLLPDHSPPLPSPPLPQAGILLHHQHHGNQVAITDQPKRVQCRRFCLINRAPPARWRTLRFLTTNQEPMPISAILRAVWPKGGVAARSMNLGFRGSRLCLPRGRSRRRRLRHMLHHPASRYRCHHPSRDTHHHRKRGKPRHRRLFPHTPYCHHPDASCRAIAPWHRRMTLPRPLVPRPNLLERCMAIGVGCRSSQFPVRLR
jgi:hypothetical protein